MARIPSFSTSLRFVAKTTSPKPRHSLNLLYKVLLSGLFHYLNNEVMYLTLNRVTPVTLAVGNTVKRVFIIAASVIVLGNQVGTKSVVGSTVAISGVLLYSFAKMKFE